MNAPPPLDLRTIGSALYGERWMTDLSGALGVSDRTIRRWAAGTQELPPGVVEQLAALCRAQAVRLLKLSVLLGGPVPVSPVEDE